MKQVSCPSCGAPVEIKTGSALLVVCAYCSSSLLRRDVDLEAVGKMAQLVEDGSPIQLGATGHYGHRPFDVVGRIQLQYPQGYWNEWYLRYDDQSTGWLGEGSGRYCVTALVAQREGLPTFDALSVGHTVTIGGVAYRVREKSQARCVGGAGELPFAINAGYDAPVADLEGAGSRFATLDYSEDPPLAFVGELVEFDALGLAGLREFPGW